jgi:hypothetical protein
MLENNKKRGGWFNGRSRKKTAKKNKKKALTVKNFFPTRKNFQGFDLHLCKYEESISLWQSFALLT